MQAIPIAIVLPEISTNFEQGDMWLWSKPIMDIYKKISIRKKLTWFNSSRATVTQNQNINRSGNNDNKNYF